MRQPTNRGRQAGQGDGTIPRSYWVLSAHREAVLAVVDGVVWAASITLTMLLRFQMQPAPSFTADLALMIGVAVVAQVAIGVAWGLYRTRWRIGSFEEMLALAKTVLTVTVLVTVVDVTRAQHFVPVSATIGGGAVALVVAGALRSLWRLHWEHRKLPAAAAERAVIFGAGEGAAQLITSLLTDPTSPYVPVALIDDDRAKRNARLRHLKVCGTRHDLAEVAQRVRAETVIVAIPSAGAELVRALSDLAVGAGLTVKVLPTTSQILSPLTVDDVRPVTEEDLLGRRVIDTEIDQIAGYLTGRRVLVTGAGGCIGSELCRQIYQHAPAQLVMLDRDESGLHQVQLSIEGRATLDQRELVVCDIRDRGALDAVFAEHRPEVVFHAAALKHLPLLEMWPAEAWKTNVVGTQNVLDAAADAGVDRVVNISTDKAAKPASVLGYSKRIAERLTAAAGLDRGGSYLSVRFGNVLGSRGSVLTTFRAQIARGGPLTVTDPAVTRYFMTVEEAVQLVVQAGAIGRNGEVLVLDMGQPVRIEDVAQRLVLEADRPIDIVYTGLRPGEKLHEQLFDDHEADERPVHPLISHVPVPPLTYGAVAESGLAAGPADVTKRHLAALCRLGAGVRRPSVGAAVVLE